jgi:site-specific DNA-methyltransferase (adenine-specific)
MSYRVLQGDCLELLPALVSDSIDCAIVDPPYGETSLPWDKPVRGWTDQMARVVKPTGSMWVFGSLRHFCEAYRVGEFSRWKLSQEVIWEKHNGTGLFNDRFRRVHEIVAHFYRADSKWTDVFKAPQFSNDATARTIRKKGRPAQWIGATGQTLYKSEDGGPRLQRSVIYVRSEHGRAEHPTQKPLGIIEPLLLYACPVGGHVLDPFAGSGGVGILAKRHKMFCTLMEANPEFVELIKRRIADEAPLFHVE